MPLNSDFRDLLRAFNEEQVRYIVVGAYALMLYTEPRFTKDLDVWVESSSENAQRVYRALARFGAPLRGIVPDDFAIAGQVYQLGIAPNRVDVLTAVTGLEFADAWTNRRQAELGDVSANFLGRTDLARNKRAVGRPQDLVDVENLEGNNKQ